MRNLKKSEEIVLLILTAILIGLFYYQFVYKGVVNARTQYDTSILEMELQSYETKAATMKQMEEEIASEKEASDGVVATYNNQKQEIVELNNIFADADTFDLSFANPTATSGDNTVRRSITANFSASSYAEAKEMITSLYHCKYRCLIQDISISSSGSSSSEENLASGPVQVSLTVTFYETLYNAPSTDGIDFIENESAQEEE